MEDPAIQVLFDFNVHLFFLSKIVIQLQQLSPGNKLLRGASENVSF